MKFKVLKPFFKLSEQRNYSVDEVIELSKEDAQAMLNDNFIEDVNKPFKDKGTKGIVSRKTIEEADAEIKEANKEVIIDTKEGFVNLQDTDND